MPSDVVGTDRRYPAMTEYRRSRLHGMLTDILTEQRAAELYHKYAALPDSELTGDLATGFSFWTTTERDENGHILKLVHTKVTPLTMVALVA